MPALKTKMRLPNGEVTEMFYVGSLAKALGRTPSTIRKWEIANIIPDSIFRDQNDRRLYTQEQIDAIVFCAEKAQIKQGNSIAHTCFSKWCHAEMKKLREKYQKKV